MDGTPDPAALGPLREIFAKADEPERYRLLVSLFAEVASICHNGSGPSSESANQIASLGKRVQDLEKRRADLEDQLRTTQADLVHRSKQFEAEQARSQEIQAVTANQRTRLETLEAELQRLEAELVNRNSDLHRAETERESLVLRLQRAEKASTDTTHSDALEEGKRDLAAKVQSLETAMEQLRQEKNAEIERLNADLVGARGQSSQSADALLAAIWQRLAAAKPPLVTEAHVQPTVQAAERLVDTFIELATFAHKLDQDMRPNLDGFTKFNEEIRRLWTIYKEQCDLHQAIRQTIVPVQSRHVGALKMQLKVCRNWAFAALVSSDSAMEWIADELRTHLLGPSGAGANPKCTIKDYVRESGPEAFLEHMRKLRSDKLAEIYSRGV